MLTLLKLVAAFLCLFAAFICPTVVLSGGFVCVGVGIALLF